MLIHLPAEGIEPTLPKERDFESRASANSATPAQWLFVTPAGFPGKPKIKCMPLVGLAKVRKAAVASNRKFVHCGGLTNKNV
jgi:hypothetical protein